MTKQLVVEHKGYVVLPRVRGKDKKISLNLNTYRNLHYMTSNEAKRLCKEEVKAYLISTGQDSVRFNGKVKATFKRYKGSNVKSDKGNFYSVGTKFIYDALVELGVLADDNDDIIQDEHLYPTELDRENPRIVITLEEC